MFGPGGRALRRALIFAGAVGCGATPPVAAEATIASKPPATAAPIESASQPVAEPPFVLFADRRSEGAALAVACGTFVVRRGEAGDGRVSVIDARGATVLELKPGDASERVDAAWCGDLDGDGRPELALFRISGGAHCCRTDVVVTLDDRPVERLRVEAGNAGGLRPEDVDGDGKLELVSTDDALVELGDLPYALTPFLTVVFSLEGGRFVRRTPRFKRLLEVERGAAEVELAGCSGDPGCEIGLGEKLLALGLLLGDAEDASRRLAVGPEARRAVKAGAPRLAKILRARGEPLP